MVKLLLTRFVAAAAVTMTIVGTAAAQDVKLRAVNFVPNVQAFGKPLVDYVDMVHKASGGSIQISILPPGTMSPFDMGTAIKNGVVDMGNVPSTFFQNLLPVGEAIKLGNTSSVEQRANGAFAFLDELHQKHVNAKLLSTWGQEVRFHLYLRDRPIAKADLAGFKIRTTPIYRAFFRALGADLIQAPPGEVYTMLERGTIDGYGWPLWDIKTPGWDRVTKYRVEPGFYSVTSAFLVNLDKWKSLTPAQRDLLGKTAIEFERAFAARVPELNARYTKEQKGAGVQVIELKGAERAKFERLAVEAGWAEHDKLDPANAPKLRKLIVK